MKKSTRFFLVLFFMVFSVWGAANAFPSPPNFDFDIRSHHLNIQIDPFKRFIRAEDRVEIHLKGKEAQTFTFLLHPDLKIIRIENSKTGDALPWTEGTFEHHAKRLDISFKKIEEYPSLSISYEGKIDDPVVKEKALQFVRGDQTSGTIRPEGVYLSSSSGWYPDRPNSMAAFRVKAAIPEPFRIVTQGELLSEKLVEGFWKSEWSYDLPAESLTLVAGKYSVKTRSVDGITISTYFFPEDDKLSKIFLDAAEEYLKTYSTLLGEYPFKKFDIVQNFFSSGYGFPTFTLLAPEAIRQGREFLKPGTLDHEMVHSWWGHYVSFKPGTGNWVEALTSYCTNYYSRELGKDKESAFKYRQDVLQKYAVQVPFSEDYPLRRFEEKHEEIDGQIGYGKGSMVFHVLREIVGKDLFFSTLRKFAKRYGGKQAGWDDLRQIFEETSGKKLERFFSQWLDRSAGPRLKLENVRVKVVSKGYLISGEVVQEGEAYEVKAQVEVERGHVKENFFLDLSSNRAAFSFLVQKLPLRITLDPEYHLFRRLYPEEVIPSLNALLEDREKIFVVPDEGDEESRKIYFELAKMAKERKGGKILFPKEITEEEAFRSSLMLLGESWKSLSFSKLLSNLPNSISLKNNRFSIGGKLVSEEDESILFTYPHPFRPGRWVTIYTGSSPAALSRARYIFFYGWDSIILFDKGRPKKRENLPARRSFLIYDVLSNSHFGEIQDKRLRDHVSYLASPQLAGRFPGTSGYEQARDYLVKEMEGIGISPIIQRFSIMVKDIETATLIWRTPGEEERVRMVPFIFSNEGEWKGECVSEEGGNASGNIWSKAVSVEYCSKCSETDAGEFLWGKIMEWQSRGASAIFFSVEEEDLDHLSPYVSYPSYFPPKLEEKLMKKEREGFSANRLVEASKVASRGKEPDFPITIPIGFILHTQEGGDRMKNSLGHGEISIEVSIRFKEMRFRDANVGAIIKGHDPEKKDEFLVLGAHYDHLGRVEKGDSYYSGADDNGSGVSALLEIGRSLMKRGADLKRSVLLLFFGGEEWGLWGSRHFVQEPLFPLSQMKAMYSLDSIGGKKGSPEVFFIGKSFYPSLAERSRGFLRGLNMKEGPEIDRYAFTYGSDHYPFHLKGIPSIDYFASDYKKIHSLQDNLESVDFQSLANVTRLIYLTAYEFLTEP